MLQGNLCVNNRNEKENSPLYRKLYRISAGTPCTTDILVSCRYRQILGVLWQFIWLYSDLINRPLARKLWFPLDFNSTSARIPSSMKADLPLKIVCLTKTSICQSCLRLSLPPSRSPPLALAASLHFGNPSRREAFAADVDPQEVNMFFRSPSTSLRLLSFVLSLWLTLTSFFTSTQR